MAHRLVMSLTKRSLRSRRTLRADNDEKVILHQFPPLKDSPNGSPPCLKLETFLRMANISYEVQYGMIPSSKGKQPWIEYKGSEVADSNFCIEFLCKEFEVDLNADLSPAEKATALAFQRTCDEHTYWTIVYNRWIDRFDDAKTMFRMAKMEMMNNIAAKLMRRYFTDQLKGHGIGCHEREEVYHLAFEDIHAISDFLGNKKFMMGDKATIVDASVFGLMACFLWVDKASPMHEFITGECNNIESYCHRMKETFYPDWEEIVSRKNDS